MNSINIGKSMRGFMEIYLINTGVRFDIFSILHNSNGLSMNELAKKVKVPEKYVKMWCDTAFAFKVLDKKGDKFLLKPELNDNLADKNSTKYMGDFIRILASYLGKDMERQYEFIKAGKSFPFHEHDVEFIELVVNRGKQRGTIFIEKVIPLIEDFDKNLIDGLNVLDVGCGGGGFIKSLADKHNNSKFTGVELDKKSVELAKKLVDNENAEFFQSSAHEIKFSEEFDAVTMNLVLHEVNPSYRGEIVSNIYKSLKKEGKLIILEFPYPEKDKEFSDPNFAMGIYDQFFEIIWGTEHITWSQQKELLQKCGFKNVEREFLGDNTYVLITADK